ncbi:MAG: helix-turn-helix domain-containing protein [Bacillota bacterium]|nr:helix-turn-helix domain-containing protein [Bacillota bacterium]
MEREWITVQEAAEYLGVARSTIYRWAKEGRLPIYKLAEGVARVKVQDLRKFLAEAQLLYDQSGEAYPLEKAHLAPREPGEDPLLGVIGSLSGEPLSAREIEDELYGKGAR